MTPRAFLIAISIYCSHHTNFYKTRGFRFRKIKGNVFLPQSCRSEGERCFFLTSVNHRVFVLWFPIEMTKDFTGKVSCGAAVPENVLWPENSLALSTGRVFLFFFLLLVFIGFHLIHAHVVLKAALTQWTLIHTPRDDTDEELLRFCTNEKLLFECECQILLRHFCFHRTLKIGNKWKTGWHSKGYEYDTNAQQHGSRSFYSLNGDITLRRKRCSVILSIFLTWDNRNSTSTGFYFMNKYG